MKSRDPEFRIPVDKESFRCYKCDYVVLKDTGGMNEVEPGLAARMCDDCYSPKKDPTKVKNDSKASDSDASGPEDAKGQGNSSGSARIGSDSGTSSVRGEGPVGSANPVAEQRQDEDYSAGRLGGTTPRDLPESTPAAA